MQDLRLIGVHEDGEHLLLTDPTGARFRVRVDEPLRAAVRRDRPRLGQLQIEIDGGLRPRDVQAMIRAGASVEEVAERAGWAVEKVHRYEGPIVAEREHVAGLARGVRLRGRGGNSASAPTLAARVGQRLTGRGVDPAEASWDSWRADEGPWTVVVTFPAGGRQRQASWHFDMADRTVTAVDDEARWLSEDEAPAGAGPIPAPHLVSSPVRATTVYDVEAEGGLLTGAARATQRPATPEAGPVDLMTAMRERSAARGRRGGGRRGPRHAPTHVPGPGPSAPDEALPLEDLAYDPETMPPPPPAHVHPEEPSDLDARPEPDAAAEPAPSGPVPAAPQGDTSGEALADDELDGGIAELGGPAQVDDDPAAHDDPAQDDSPQDDVAQDVPVHDDTTVAPAPDDADTLEPVGSEVPPEHAADGPSDEETVDDEETGARQPVPVQAVEDSDIEDAAIEDAADEQAVEDPTEPAPAKPARRKSGRPSVPSWDDIMFGARPGRG